MDGMVKGVKIKDGGCRDMRVCWPCGLSLPEGERALRW